MLFQGQVIDSSRFAAPDHLAYLYFVVGCVLVAVFLVLGEYLLNLWWASVLRHRSSVEHPKQCRLPALFRGLGGSWGEGSERDGRD